MEKGMHAHARESIAEEFRTRKTQAATTL